MPSFIRNTSGGTAVAGGSLAPRSRRGNTNQADAYWRGGGANSPTLVEYLVVAGGAGGGAGVNATGGGGAGGARTNAAIDFAVSAGTAYTITVGGGGSAGGNPGGAGGTSTFSTINASGGGVGVTFARETAYPAECERRRRGCDILKPDGRHLFVFGSLGCLFLPDLKHARNVVFGTTIYYERVLVKFFIEYHMETRMKRIIHTRLCK